MQETSEEQDHPASDRGIIKTRIKNGIRVSLVVHGKNSMVNLMKDPMNFNTALIHAKDRTAPDGRMAGIGSCRSDGGAPVCCIVVKK